MKSDKKQLLNLILSIISTVSVALLINKLQVPNPNVILISIIVFFTFSGGFLSGIPSGIIAIIYSFFFFSEKEHLFSYTLESKEKLIVICIFIPVIVLIVGSLKRKTIMKSMALISANKKLEILANVDALTHIPNRRFLDRVFHDEYIRAARIKAPISFVIIDIDFFKQYNDTYGHIRGDECLRRVAKAINDTVQRTGDYVARYGGEEFSLILPNTDEDGAKVLCERVRKSIEMLRIRHRASADSKNVTVSIGIASDFASIAKDRLQLMEHADKALYQAKMDGRNRIKVYSRCKIKEKINV